MQLDGSAQGDDAIFAALEARDGLRAFTLLQASYGRQVERLAARMVRDPVLAEDVSQNALLQIFRDLGRLRPGSDVRAWTMTVVAHRALDALRKRARWQRRLVDVEHLAEPEAPGPDPGETAASAQATRALAACLDRLPPKVQAAITMRFVDGRTFGEIAAEVGESADAVRVRVARALPRLRRSLARHGVAAAA